MFSDMSENNLKNAINYDRNYFRVRNYEYVKMLFAMIGKLDKKYVSQLMASAETGITRRYRNIHGQIELTQKMHHMGPCIPGVQRVFVNTNGLLFPCEKVNETNDYTEIGSLENSFNIEQVRKLLNIGTTVENYCKECWVLRQCSRCISQIEFVDEPLVEDVSAECRKTISSVRFGLYELAVLSEFDFQPEERGTV
jgi:uncharacterized protein